MLWKKRKKKRGKGEIQRIEGRRDRQTDRLTDGQTKNHGQDGAIKDKLSPFFLGEKRSRLID
jgi:hypothetical protein